MSNPAPTSLPRRVASAVWRPAGVLHLAIALAAMAMGFWPGLIRPHAVGPAAAPLPALAYLAVGEVAFFLLIWPIVLAGRRMRGGPGTSLAGTLLEGAMMILSAAPLYALAAFFSDANTIEALRVALYVAALVPLSLAGGAWLADETFRPVGLAAMVTVALGLPAAYYLCLDLLGYGPDRLDWLWNATPALWGPSLARPRGDAMAPRPLWAWLGWAAAGGIALALHALPGRGRGDGGATGSLAETPETTAGRRTNQPVASADSPDA